MKRIEYQGKKWDKKREKENSTYQLIINNLMELEEDWKKGECEEIFYHISKSSKMLLLSKTTYILGEVDKCLEYMNTLVDETIQMCKLYEEGINVIDGVRRTINSVMEKGIEAYYAVAIDRISDVEKVTNSNHILRLLLNGEYDKVKENYKKNDSIGQMLFAICENDEQKFEDALTNRIKEIRRFAEDYMIIIDVWSVALAKIAQQQGMQFYCNYIEVPDFLLNKYNSNKEDGKSSIK